jgi:hypothetical protein
MMQGSAFMYIIDCLSNPCSRLSSSNPYPSISDRVRITPIKAVNNMGINIVSFISFFIVIGFAIHFGYGLGPLVFEKFIAAILCALAVNQASIEDAID